MIRKIIQIDDKKCNGCGACAEACHEGAIGMVNGKAKLLRDDYCDGLGDCLPTCPTSAISFVEREAAAYDEKAVQENMRKKNRMNSINQFNASLRQEEAEASIWSFAPSVLRQNLFLQLQKLNSTAVLHCVSMMEFRPE